MKPQIIHKVTLDREINPGDRFKKIGYKDFVRKMNEAGWMKGEVVVKRFSFSYYSRGRTIVWKATLQE